MTRRDFLQHGRYRTSRLLMQPAYTETRTLSTATSTMSAARIQAAFDRLAAAGLYRTGQSERRDFTKPVLYPGFISDCERINEVSQHE